MCKLKKSECRHIIELNEENEKLRVENEQLKKELEKYKKPPKNSSNSSIPPSQDKYDKKYPSRECSGRKTGGQKGHKGYTKTQIENPDEIIELFPEKCSCCGSEYFFKQNQNTKRRQVFDIPEIQPFVTEYRQIAGICSNCGKKNIVKFPDNVKSNVQTGTNARSIMGYLNVQNHLSYERIKQIFNDIFNFEISEGTIDTKIKELEEKLTPAYNNILEGLKKSGIIGSDETGTRVKKENWQQWIFQNDDFSYFKTKKSRGFDVIEGLFGKKFDGCWISDRLGSQLKIESNHQLCSAHLIRNCKYSIEAEKSEWSKELKQILEDGIKLRNSMQDFNPCSIEEFREIQKIKKRLDEIFSKSPPKDEAKKLYKGLLGRQKQLTLFLENPKVPATNNGSERALRNRVIHRKVCGCFRTPDGAKSHDVIASIIETAKKQGKNILDVLMNPSLQFDFQTT